MEQVVPLIATTGWAAGVNAYATVAMLCIAARANLVELPAAFDRTDVLVIAGAMFAVEFVADKVPFVDSGWDAIQTAIRPLVGGVTGALLAGEDGAGALVQLAAGGGAGAVSLASHSAKAGIRLAVNGSPEPFSNIALSTGEDVTVAALVLLATDHPWLAATVAAILLVIGLTLAYYLVSRVRAGLRRVQAKLGTAPP